VQGEAATSDTVAAESFPQDLVKIVDDGGYTKDEIFNVDEMWLFLKKLPSRIFIAEKEKTMPGFKPANTPSKCQCLWHLYLNAKACVNLPFRKP
jgi:hypothetical protein